MSRATEAEWYENVRALARMGQWSLYHAHDSRRSAAGWPDCVFLRVDPAFGPPTLLFRELKLAGKRPTPSPRAWLDGLVAAGQDAATWTFPADWELAVETLTRRRENVTVIAC